ncbi:MAG: hypothetical protein AB7W59_04605 [Acidimicrobiia bacterium]
MLSWGTILLSAALTAVATLFGMAPFERPLEARRLLLTAAAAAAGPILWHGLTRVATPGPLTVELATEAFPASRSDVGVGVCTLATVALVGGLGLDRKLAAGRVLTIALGAAVAAFGIAVYLT